MADFGDHLGYFFGLNDVVGVSSCAGKTEPAEDKLWAYNRTTGALTAAGASQSGCMAVSSSGVLLLPCDPTDPNQAWNIQT